MTMKCVGGQSEPDEDAKAAYKKVFVDAVNEIASCALTTEQASEEYDPFLDTLINAARMYLNYAAPPVNKSVMTDEERAEFEKDFKFYSGAVQWNDDATEVVDPQWFMKWPSLPIGTVLRIKLPLQYRQEQRPDCSEFPDVIASSHMLDAWCKVAFGHVDEEPDYGENA